MAKKLLIGGLLGGIAMFIWQGVWWAAGPMMMPQLKPLPGGESIPAAMAGAGMETGIYYYPPHPEPTGNKDSDKAAWEDMTETARQGPTIAFMSYQAGGYDPLSAEWYIKGLLADIIACIVVTLLLGMVSGVLPKFTQRMFFCTAIGFAGVLTGAVVLDGFFLIPLPFMLGQVIDQIGGWTAAGALIALATRPASTAIA